MKIITIDTIDELKELVEQLEDGQVLRVYVEIISNGRDEVSSERG